MAKSLQSNSKKALKLLAVLFVVLFVVGPITSTVIYLAGKAVMKKENV